tara:strand:+ start:728 stop:1687 length:960 start_codon:yes stop_codon:yes gene_type:complete
MSTNWTKKLFSAAFAAALTISASPAMAAFPDKPITFVTPYPPGGSHSLHAGVITTVAEPYFGQPMISVIRKGGGGAVGAAGVLKAPADGYTLLFGDPTINSLRPQVEKLPYGTDDFKAVARINYSPAVFVARADAPFKNLKGMIEYAKANPGKLVHSNDNKNGFTYTVFEMLKFKSGTDMKGITYGGGGPAMAKILGGETMAYAGAPSVVAEHIKSGKLVGICTTDFEPWPSLPDVPTCKSLGTDIIFHFWRGVVVPKDTPDSVVAKLSAGFEKLVGDKGFLRLIGKINSRVDFLGYKEFDALLKKEQADLKALYNSLN